MISGVIAFFVSMTKYDKNYAIKLFENLSFML